MPLLPVNSGQVVTVATFFRVTALIGAGRYSEVYAAFDTQSQADVALKLYTATDASSHALALAEAEVLNTLSALNSDYFPRLKYSVKHRLNNRPHPVLVMELGAYHREDGQRDFIKLSELIPESSANQRPLKSVDGGFWQASSLMAWIIHLFEAVRLVHASKIIHRDIKPANVLVKRTANKTDTLPLLLDFNSSPNGAESQRGTPRYLPPEAIKRLSASTEDDVWAAALVAWELLHGLSSSTSDNIELGDWIVGTIPRQFVEALRAALVLDVERRVRGAEAVINALEAAVGKSVEPDQSLVMGASEFADSLAAQSSVRLLIEDALSPPHMLIVPKDIEESVHSLLLWLNQEETQALDLVGELVRLGPRAIPACLNQGHKLSPDSAAADKVITALTQLGRADRQLAEKAIELYSTSSNASVRFLCRRLCMTLEVFPLVMLNALHDDLEVLLPDERLELALLCVAHSKSEKAGGTALQFMCREYIANPDRYLALGTVVQAMSKLTHPKRAALIEWYARNERWKQLREYQQLGADERENVDRGVLELIGDAFGAMGAAALELLRLGRVARKTEGEPGKPLFRKFVPKLAKRYEPAKQWLLAQASSNPDDYDLKRAVESLRLDEPRVENLKASFDEYLKTGDQDSFNTLRFSRGPSVFNLIYETLRADHGGPAFRRIARLLEGFESRQRRSVVRCVLEFWDRYELHDAGAGIRTLSRHAIQDEQLRSRAVATLNDLLNGPHAVAARKGIEHLLA